MKRMNGLFASLSLALPLALSMSGAAAADFSPCVDARSAPALNGTLCAIEVLPLSFAAHQLEGMPSVNIFVREFPAPKKSKGSVWLVAGGPGDSGAALYPSIATLRRSFPDFDLIVPDARGTGFSSRLCPNEEGVDGPGGGALVGAERASCLKRLNDDTETLHFYTVSNAARDLIYLIDQTKGQAGADKPLYLYGASYGTQVILRALQLEKLPVTGLVLDSLTAPEGAAQWDASQRSKLTDAVGRQVLADCDADPACRAVLGDGAEAAYRRLLASVAQRPQWLAALPEHDPKRFFGGLLDSPSLRARIPYLIRDLLQGHDAELNAVLARQQKDMAPAYPQSPPSVLLAALIGASENDLRPALTPPQLRQEDEVSWFTSALPEQLSEPGFPLYARDEYFGKQPAQLPPTLVLNGTRDPREAYDGAVSHVAALRAAGKVSLISVAGAPGPVVATAPACFERTTRDFVSGKGVADQQCQVDKAAP
jgi:pimeloyl-ACP methyl ester carboxylesterase